MNEPRWLTLARDLVGLKEIKGAQHAPEILRLWKDAHLPFTDDETAWCAGFVGGCLERAGVNSTRAANARSYSHWGIDVLANGDLQIPLGAVVVYKRDPNPAQGHVGFAVGLTPEGYIMTLGGNQGDSVSIKPFNFDRLIAARWPAEFADDLGLLRYLPTMAANGKLSEGEA